MRLSLLPVLPAMKLIYNIRTAQQFNLRVAHGFRATYVDIGSTPRAKQPGQPPRQPGPALAAMTACFRSSGVYRWHLPFIYLLGRIPPVGVCYCYCNKRQHQHRLAVIEM